jgi:hypothetical protein
LLKCDSVNALLGIATTPWHGNQQLLLLLFGAWVSDQDVLPAQSLWAQGFDLLNVMDLQSAVNIAAEMQVGSAS